MSESTLFAYRNFRTLHCLRNFIHVNLLACYTVYDAMWLLFALIGSLLKHEIEQYESYRLCVAISIIMKYFLTASFFWMMVEGAYLLIGVMFSFHLQRIRYWWTLLFGWGNWLFCINCVWTWVYKFWYRYEAKFLAQRRDKVFYARGVFLYEHYDSKLF